MWLCPDSVPTVQFSPWTDWAVGGGGGAWQRTQIGSSATASLFSSVPLVTKKMR